MSSQIKDILEEEAEPTVDSQLIEERIAARRLRILRRLEVIRK